MGGRVRDRGGRGGAGEWQGREGLTERPNMEPQCIALQCRDVYEKSSRRYVRHAHA